MKTFFLPVIFGLLSVISYAQKSIVLIDNEEFYIKYELTNNASFTIEIEDLKDNSVEGANQFPVPEHVDIYDYCKIETDRNNDKKFSSIDRDFLRSVGIGNGGIFCKQYKNSASGLTSTDKQLRKHIMYRFTIPFQEAITNNIDTVRFRIKIRRQNSLEKTDNTMFVFPTQNSNDFISYKLPVPENLVKRVEKPRIVNADIYTKAPDFFGTYLLSGPKFYGLISSKITKGYISTYENVASGNIQTWGTIESSRKIDYIDKQNGFTRVINKNRGDYILNKDIESKIVAINSGLSKILAVGDAGSITNLKIFKLTPQETSEGIITANGQPEGTVIYTFSNEYTPNASKTISPTSIIYNYAEFGKGLYALIYKGEAYPFKIE